MSLVRMRKSMQSKLHLIMLALAFVFAVGWIGLCLSSGGTGGGDGGQQAGLVGRVNKQKLDRVAFELLVEKTKSRIETGGRMVSAFEESQLRGSVLDDMIGSVLRNEAARKLRVKVGRRDMNAAVKQIVDAQIAQVRSRFMAGRPGSLSDTALDAVLRKQGMSLSKIESEVRASIDTDMLREQLLTEKITKKLQEGVDTSDNAIRASFDEVRFRQISVGGQTRSMAQAETRAKEISGKLKNADFAAVASQYSDDPYKASGGDRGMFVRRDYLDKALADAVFSLKPGQVSEPIKLPTGYVIVKVEQKRSALPADFNDPKKMKAYKDSYVAQQQFMVQSKFFSDMQKDAKIVIYDPELRAYTAAKEFSGLVGSNPVQAKAKAMEVLKDLQTASTQAGADTQASARVYAQMGYIYDWLRKPDLFKPTKEERIKYRKEARIALENALQYTEANDLRTMLADIAIEEGQYDKALEHLDMVSQNAFDDPAAHKQLLQRYEKLQAYEPQKVAGLIAEERKWVADYDKLMKAQQEQQGGMTSKPFRVGPPAGKPGG
jgi:parvulin-like peptidyl-prolyl isomerase